MATLVDPVEAGHVARKVTVSLPGPLHDRIQRSADEKQHRSFKEVLVEAAAAGLLSRHAR
ncbi:MAG: hypothetical protein ACMG6S_27415 [Byssovorax sp.]